MLTALLAARNVLGEMAKDGSPHNLWDVNVERSYHEAFTVEEAKAQANRDVKRSEERAAETLVPR